MAGKESVCLESTEEKDEGADIGGQTREGRLAAKGHCVTYLEPGHEAWAPWLGFN